MSAQLDLAAALVASLDDRALEELAQRLAPYLPERERQEQDAGWLDAKAAAEYLGLPNAGQLHKLTAARAIDFSQEAPGAKCYFRRADLDAYRERHMRGPGLR